MEKIWLKNYEPGVPETINPDEYGSLSELIEESLAQHAAKKCFSNFGTTLTYSQIDELSACFAGFLQKQFRLSEGDRVAIMLPNILQYPVATFGVLRAGMTVVNINPLYTARELKNILKNSGARCIVVFANFAHVLEEVLPDTKVEYVIVAKIGDLLGDGKGFIYNFVSKYIKKMVPDWNIPSAYSFKQVAALHNRHLFEPIKIKSDEIAFLQYTGGTTGGAKGVMLTHRNMVANVLQGSAWMQSLLKQNLEDGVITALPLYHIFSLLANCLLFFRVGLENILITNPRDIPGFVKELKRHPFSIMAGVNTLFNALLKNEDFCKLDFSKFKFTLGGGMAVQKAVAERWKQVTGVTLLEAYGLTETSPAVTVNPLNLKAFNGSIGLPISSTEIKIIDDAGNELPLGQSGELCVRGPQVMKGYWKQPEATALVLDESGWLRTGDVATVDEQGFVRIVDRKKDIIIVSGFNVVPNEVEGVIMEMKGVREVAVVGVKSAEEGERVKAYVVRDDPTLTPDDIISYCHKYLTGYKVPKEIEFRNELEKTNVGKILRRSLRE